MKRIALLLLFALVSSASAAGCTVEAADLEEAVSIVADAFLSAISDFEAAGKEAEPC